MTPFLLNFLDLVYRPDLTSLTNVYYLNYPCFSKCCVRTILINSLDCFCRESENNTLFKFRNVNPLFLKINIFSHFTGRIKLRSARTV